MKWKNRWQISFIELVCNTLFFIGFVCETGDFFYQFFYKCNFVRSNSRFHSSSDVSYEIPFFVLVFYWQQPLYLNCILSFRIFCCYWRNTNQVSFGSQFPQCVSCDSNNSNGQRWIITKYIQVTQYHCYIIYFVFLANEMNWIYSVKLFRYKWRICMNVIFFRFCTVKVAILFLILVLVNCSFENV